MAQYGSVIFSYLPFLHSYSNRIRELSLAISATTERVSLRKIKSWASNDCVVCTVWSVRVVTISSLSESTVCGYTQTPRTLSC